MALRLPIVASVSGGSGIPEDYIAGLGLTWGAADSLTIGSGTCWIPGISAALYTAGLVKSGLVLAASTWHHLYLFQNGGAADVEVSTVAPGAPYLGSARTKTGDTSRRYLGSVLTDASGGLHTFRQKTVGSRFEVDWIEQSNTAPFRLLDHATATPPANLNAAAMIACGAITHLVLGCILETNAVCDLTIGVGAIMDDAAGTPALSAGLYTRYPFVNIYGGGGATLFFLPPYPVKLSEGSSVLRYTVNYNSGGGGNLSIDCRGFHGVR